jgi:serine/threonine protein kinase
MLDVALPLAESIAARRYELLDHVHRSGGFDVYEAWSGSRHCRCLIKAPRPDWADDHVLLGRLEREGRLLCGATHPHILRGYEVLPAPAPAVVTEALRGETLSRLLTASKRLSAEEAAVLGLQLSSAVAYLHEQGYLHLGLASSNVVIDAGRAILVDLSSAQPPGYGSPGLGEWCYLAPEQAQGTRLGPAADVWGIGSVLFDALTGRAPFESAGDAYANVRADEEESAVYPQLTRRAPLVGSLRRLPVSLARAVDSCLEPDPERRPSIAELAAVLQNVLGRERARFAVGANGSPHVGRNNRR